MNEQKSFWKGFLLASGLAVVFMAGKVSAGPVSTTTLDDTSRAVNDLRYEVKGIRSEISSLRQNGMKVKVENSSWPLEVKIKD